MVETTEVNDVAERRVSAGQSEYRVSNSSTSDRVHTHMDILTHFIALWFKMNRMQYNLSA